jgi:hypothetical protein
MLSGIYRELYNGPLYSDLIDKLAKECYDKYDNINFMLDRPKFFEQTGRAQNQEESINIDNAILEMFKNENLPFFYLKDLTDNAVDVAFKYIQKRHLKSQSKT